MVKINKYLILIQLFVLTLIYQNIIQCAARIQTEQSATNLDLELIENARLGNKEKVEQLIEAGANVNAGDQYGRTALMLARGNANDVIGIIKNTALIPPTDKGHKDIAKLLIKHKANVNAVDDFGNTPLMYAANNGYKESVELLITHGADVNAIDKCGDTALLWAASSGYNEIVELLLCAGADISHKNIDEQNAIDLARKFDYQEIVKMLEGEPARREAVVKKWIKEHLARKITEATSEQLFADISNIIAEYYSIEYTDLPLEYRLSN